jgi:hypothetical protein
VDKKAVCFTELLLERKKAKHGAISIPEIHSHIIIHTLFIVLPISNDDSVFQIKPGDENVGHSS